MPLSFFLKVIWVYGCEWHGAGWVPWGMSVWRDPEFHRHRRVQACGHSSSQACFDAVGVQVLSGLGSTWRLHTSSSHLRKWLDIIIRSPGRPRRAGVLNTTKPNTWLRIFRHRCSFPSSRKRGVCWEESVAEVWWEVE